MNGSLSFLNNNNWTYFTPPPESTPPTFEDLTTTSPHAGTLSAFRLGTTFRTRYSPLLASSKPINFWSASSPRDVETALYFGDGLFGRNWSQPSPPDSPNLHPVAKLHIIPETPDRGSNTLTPGCTCQNYMTNTTHGHALGYKKLAEWQSVFTTPIIARFSAENPRLQPPLSTVEIYSMMEMCGFEMLSRGPGSSPWCTVFRREEWEDFEYARDVLHFYRAGPGNRFAGVMGGLWLDATSKLLEQPSGGNGEGEVYVSFVHDGDIVSVLAALGVIHGEEEEELPTDQVLHNRTWRTSTLVPMAGRLVIERLNCRTPHGWRWRDVRLWINDGGVGLTGEGDKGKRVLIPQMEVGRFREMIKKKVEGYGSFREVCGLKDEEGEGITFLHQ